MARWMRASSLFPAGLGYKMNMGDVGSEGVLMVGWVGDKQHKPFLIYDGVQTNHALHIASQRGQIQVLNVISALCFGSFACSQKMWVILAMLLKVFQIISEFLNGRPPQQYTEKRDI